MILEKQKEAMVHQEGESQESIGMSLDLESAQVLMQMLSKNLYSDAIGSTIRECASNALDSHRRAGVDKPIVVSLRPNKDNIFEFSVEDFGIGLDADDVKNIISKYGKSTKRDSTTELGMMGLGFKAPLAYTSSFYFVCRKDGMERKYMMYEGEDVNTIDLLYEAPTDQPNGVKVIVPVRWSDRYQFSKKIREQLAYFESVYFDVDDITNGFVISRHEYFQFSELASDENMHICLDNVYYPIDFQKLGIDRINLPVALRFSLTDGIFPTPNREAIRYTQDAKAIILKRLSEAANYFVSKYNETVKDTLDIRAALSYYRSKQRNIKMGKSSWDVNPLSKYATVSISKPTVKGLKLLDIQRLTIIEDYILGEYESKFLINNKTCRDVAKWYGLNRISNLEDRVYICTDRVSGLKKDYLKTLSKGTHDETLVIRKVKSFSLFAKGTDYNCYYRILGLKDHPKSEWRDRIKEFQHIVNSLISTCVDLDALEVPQAFIDARKKTRVSTGKVKGGGPKRLKLKGEMVCKQAEGLERWVDGKNCKWVSKIYDMSKFHQNKFILVYGKQEDAEKMDKWFKPTRTMKVEFAILSDRETKLIEKVELHNLMPFSKFMEGKTKPFQRIATACLIDQIYDEYRNVFQNVDVLESISKDLFDKVVRLREYRSKNFRDINDDYRTIIIEHARSINQFDKTIVDDCLELKALCVKLPFINAMMGNIHRYGRVKMNEEQDQMTQAFIDLFKYHKHRIDWKNYRIRFNEDLPLEQTLTSETVEELITQS